MSVKSEDSVSERCPDEGACHHQCVDAFCNRVVTASPLTAAGFYENRWPDDELVLVKHPKSPSTVRYKHTHGNVTGVSATFQPPKFKRGDKVIWVPPRPSQQGPPQEGVVVLAYEDRPAYQVKTDSGIYLCDERDLHEWTENLDVGLQQPAPVERPFTKADRDAAQRMVVAEAPQPVDYSVRKPRLVKIGNAWIAPDSVEAVTYGADSSVARVVLQSGQAVTLRTKSGEPYDLDALIAKLERTEP